MSGKSDYSYIRADLEAYISELDDLLGNIRVLRDDCPLPLLKETEELLESGVSEIGEVLRTLRRAKNRLPPGTAKEKL